MLISLEDYRRRFVDRDADEARKEIVRRITGAQLRLPAGQDAVEAVRKTRG